MTTDEIFNIAVETVLKHEGGYIFDPDDPGGETNYGISKRNHPGVDIKNLTRSQAKEIYRRIWDQWGFDRIEDPAIASKAFDLGVNMGCNRAIALLQRALHACGLRHVDVDGLIGPQTLGAIKQADRSNLVVALRAEAAAHYRSLVASNPALAKYEKGWMNRAYA